MQDNYPTHLILKHSILRIDDDAYVTSPIEDINIPVTECWFNKKTLRSVVRVNGDILDPTIKKISHLTHQLPVRYAIILTV